MHWERVLISRTHAENFRREKTILKTILHHQENDRVGLYKVPENASTRLLCNAICFLEPYKVLQPRRM
jgi:hypothetical protein